MGVLLIIVCGLFYARWTHRNDPELITHSTSAPSESKVDAKSYDWRGSVHDPKKLIISSIGVDTFIQRMGVDQNNEIAVPSNVQLAGWFVNSVQPGERGLAIVVGHVSGVRSEGVFKNLQDLTAGDTFQIERGDGSKLNYRVISITVSKEQYAADSIFSQDPTVTSQVNLVTCTGAYNKTKQKYEDRVIVSGALVP